MKFRFYIRDWFWLSIVLLLAITLISDRLADPTREQFVDPIEQWVSGKFLLAKETGERRPTP